jgi:hypothetical protein
LKERITRLARGKVDDKKPQVEILQPSIEAVIPYGASYQGEIQIRSTNRVSLRGLIYSGSSYIRLKQQYFAGEGAILAYEVKGKALESGEDIEGFFSLVTNGGEFKIPYRFVAGEPGGKKYGALSRLEDFAEYARTDADAAVKLFSSNEFIKLDFMQELGIQALYDGLHRSQDQESAMEEFLVESRAKAELHFSAEVREKSFVCDGKELFGEITVRREGWGYTALRLTADSPFIELKKTALSVGDFAGGGRMASVEYRIVPEKLHAGRNLGSITIEGLRYTDTLPVIVDVSESEDKRKKRGAHAEYYHNYVRMMRAYLELSYIKAGRDSRLQEMKEAWVKMSELAIPDIYQRLWQVEILLLSGNNTRAEKAVAAMQSEMARVAKRDPDAYCFYIYLQMRLDGSPEARSRFIRILDSYADKGYFSPTIAMLRMKVADYEADNPKESLNRLREYYRQGLRSPFIYLEGCLIYNHYPNILHRLGDYELQVLWFGARHGCLDREVVIQAAGLAGDETAFRRMYYRSLCAFYEKWHDKTILAAICGILIRGDERSPEFFNWFELGIKQDLQITWLYDYYLYSLPDNYSGSLPYELLLYFSYNSNADSRSRERLYYYVLKDYPENSKMYKAYQVQIQAYALEQLFKGRVNVELAEMYKRVLRPEAVDRRIARALPDVLKSCLVTARGPYRSAIVCCGELVGEKLYPLKNGSTVIPLYTDSYRVFMVDSGNNRFTGRACKLTPLFTAEEAAPLLNLCHKYYPDAPMLRLAACEEYMRSDKYNEKALRALETQLGVEGLRPIYQSRIVRKLIEFFSNSDGEGEEQLLACVRSRSMRTADRIFLTETLIGKKYMSEAAGLVRQYGFNGIDRGKLLVLASSWARAREAAEPGKEDVFLTGLAHRLFAEGYFDNTILSWLCRYFNGLSCEMLEILRSSHDAGVNRYDIAGRLLSQKIFSGDIDDIGFVFRCYVEDGPANELVVRAYFVMKCADYIFKDIPIDEEVMSYIRESVRAGNSFSEIPEILRYAVLRNFSEMDEMTEQDVRLAEKLLQDCCRNGRLFSFFQPLGRMVPVPDEMIDKSIVEYRGQAEDEPELRFRFVPKEADGSDVTEKPVVTVPMIRSYEGIFMRPVQLFDDEVMEFEILINRDGTAPEAFKGNVRREDGKARLVAQRQGEGLVKVVSDDISSDNRYHRFKHLLGRVNCAEAEEWQEEVEEFARMDTLVKKLFDLM